MKLDNKGSTLIEHIVAVLVLTLMAAMVCSTLLTGSTIFLRAQTSYEDTNQAFSQMEEEVGTLSVRGGGSISFPSSSYVGTISGQYQYGGSVSEFYAD